MKALNPELEEAKAELCLLEQLVLAIFDAVPNKARVIAQFSEMSERVIAGAAASETSEEFLSALQDRRVALLAVLKDADTLTSPLHKHQSDQT